MSEDIAYGGREWIVGETLAVPHVNTTVFIFKTQHTMTSSHISVIADLMVIGAGCTTPHGHLQ